MDNGPSELPRSLALLNKQERSLSARRVRIQDRIDFLRSGGGGPVEQVAHQIAALEQEERELSRRRHELHDHIELAREKARRSRGRQPS